MNAFIFTYNSVAASRISREVKLFPGWDSIRRTIGLTLPWISNFRVRKNFHELSETVFLQTSYSIYEYLTYGLIPSGIIISTCFYLYPLMSNTGLLSWWFFLMLNFTHFHASRPIFWTFRIFLWSRIPAEHFKLSLIVISRSDLSSLHFVSRKTQFFSLVRKKKFLSRFSESKIVEKCLF